MLVFDMCRRFLPGTSEYSCCCGRIKWREGERKEGRERESCDVVFICRGIRGYCVRR